MAMSGAFSKKFFPFTVAASAALPAVLIFFFLIAPVRVALVAAKGDFDRESQLLKERMSQADRFEKASVFLATLPAETVAKAEEMIPPAKDTEGILQILEDRAAEFGFLLRNLDITEVPEKESPMPQLRVLKLSLGIAGGDYAAFVKFLGGLQKTARIFDVTSVSFSSGTGNYAVNARSYWLAESARLPAAIDEDFFRNSVFAGMERLRADLRPEPRGNEKPFSR